MDDHALEPVEGWLRAGTEVAMEIQSVLELKACVDFDFEEGFEVEDYALQVYYQYFRRLLDQYLLCDLLNFLIAIFTKII
jgi:hypothetical protein